MIEPAPGYFDSSRRLTGPNLYFDACGAVVEVLAATQAQCHAWDARVREMLLALSWPVAGIVVDRHASGASLAFAAPEDRLFAATELNEWAWQGVGFDEPAPPLPLAPGHPATWDVESALRTLEKFAAAEASPRLLALLEESARHGLPALHDDEQFSLGAGEGSQSWPLAALPGSPDWSALHDIPTALVTGSNGKTTTVRLLAAMLDASGKVAGFNCTDGVFIGGECVEAGDFSGPAGARRVLRDKRVQAAVLETARGGILRRGLAVRRADAAIVTNVSPDHFGEYGVHDLARLADAKLVVARAISNAGVLVLNADDLDLCSQSRSLACPFAWFALDANHPVLTAHRAAGGSTCGVRDGRMMLHHKGSSHDLGDICAMPLTVSGAAAYNTANLAGAALLGAALEIPAAVIAAVLASFGSQRGDNPGRLERWRFRGITVLLDYAHNPDGLSGLLRVASELRGTTGGRLGLLLGQAGNRDDGAIRDLARAAAAGRPDRVVLKDLEGYMRGRAPGEVPALLGDQLLRQGLPPSAIVTILPEVEAAQALIGWSREGDVVVLPVHNLGARGVLAAWLDALADTLA